jgi:hypothetical protein
MMFFLLLRASASGAVMEGTSQDSLAKVFPITPGVDQVQVPDFVHGFARAHRSSRMHAQEEETPILRNRPARVIR